VSKFYALAQPKQAVVYYSRPKGAFLRHSAALFRSILYFVYITFCRWRLRLSIGMFVKRTVTVCPSDHTRPQLKPCVTDGLGL